MSVLKGHKDAVIFLRLNKSGDTLISGSLDRTIRVWDTRSFVCKSVLSGHRNHVNCLELSDHDENRLISGSYDQTVRFWNLTTGEAADPIRGHEYSVTCFSKCRNGRLISASKDKTLILWDVDHGTPLHTFRGHRAPLTQVRWFPQISNYFASTARDDTAKIWDAIAGTEVRTLDGHTDEVVCLDVGNCLIATGSIDKAIKLWDIRTHESVRTLIKEGSGSIYSMQLEESLGTIIAGYSFIARDSDHVLRSWDIASGEILRTFQGHQSTVNVFQYDPKKLVSGSLDRSVKVWDTNTGENLYSIPAHKAVVRCLFFNYSHLITCGYDANICLWDFSVGTPDPICNIS